MVVHYSMRVMMSRTAGEAGTLLTHRCRLRTLGASVRWTRALA